MALLHLFCFIVAILSLDIACVTVKYTHNRNVDAETFDGMESVLSNSVKKLIREELGKETSTIVSRLQEQLASQGKRIRFLEKREVRRQMVVDRLVSKVVTLEKKYDRLLKPSSVKNQKGLNEGVDLEKGQILETNDAELQQTDKENCNDNSGCQRGIEVSERAMNDGEALSYRDQHRVTRQISHIAFSAYLDHREYLGSGAVVKLNRITFNDGNGYNQFTGVFTVPVTGVYFFTYNFVGIYHKTMVGLMIDGVEQVDAIVHPDDNEHSGGNTVIVRVQQGQNVWLEQQMENGVLQSDDTYRFCTLSGFLL